VPQVEGRLGEKRAVAIDPARISRYRRASTIPEATGTSLMTAIERAARAMYDEVQPDWDWDDPDAELLRRMYRANARAALVALREPVMAMDDGALGIWQAQIDAILGEGE
jgi:hypothetical protein